MSSGGSIKRSPSQSGSSGEDEQRCTTPQRVQVVVAQRPPASADFSDRILAPKNTSPPRGHAIYPPEVWEGYKDEIQRLYIDEGMMLKDVMRVMSEKGFRPTARMYKIRFRLWGLKKVERRNPEAPGKRVRAKSQRPVGRPSQSKAILPAPVRNGTLLSHARVSLQHIKLPKSLRVQEVVIGQFGNLLLRHLALASDQADSYWESDISQSVILIWEGVTLIEDGYNEGHNILRKGFFNLLSLFNEHTFYAITHLFFLAASRNNKTINQVLWQYLTAHSTQNLHKAHQLQCLLEHLVEFNSTPYDYHGAMTAIQVSILDQFYRLDGHKDPVLCEIIARAPMQVLRSLNWRDTISNNTRRQKIAMQSQCGVSERRYLDYLYKTAFQECELYGVFSARALRFACEVLGEVDDLFEKDKRLYYECMFVLICDDWKKWREAGDRRNPRGDRAIARLIDYTNYIESGKSVVRTTCYVSMLEMLERCQRAMGRDAEAESTVQRRRRLLKTIGNDQPASGLN
ncbi:Clr5 domain-containing protein [Xylariales sp. PMI_506]|nr:Clr5 domain-containing protein [Xylariales sp. PMI_506]